MMRSFRWIEINYLFRGLAEVSTNLQKMHYFGEFQDHNSEKPKGLSTHLKGKVGYMDNIEVLLRSILDSI